MTGEPRREVYVVPPPGSAAMLRNLTGFEHFYKFTACLKCLIPGTGAGYAPRAFNLKLGKVTTSSKCGYKPLTPDPQTEVKHEGRRLVGMTAKHVDGIKAGAPRKEIEHCKKCLAAVSGDLYYSE